MPTNPNVPPIDSFEHEYQMNARRVDMKDAILNGDVFNPAVGADRVACEQYDTHTWAPGSSGTRRTGCSPMQAGIGSEQFAVVPSKLA